MRPRGAFAVAGSLAIALFVAACGGDDGDETASASEGETTPAGDELTPAEAGSEHDLAGVCPDPIVMQQDWQPEAEHGAMYHLVGPGYQIDADAKTVTGPLVVGDVDTGVSVEVRPGGSTVGFQPVAALMYLDEDILIGAVNTDYAISSSGEQPVTAVVAPLNISPQILMWDPETYPDAESLVDVAAEGATVVTAGDTIQKLLLSQGIIDESQMDTGYEGTPARFVGDPSILQQGFISAEPYIYEHEVSNWGRPIAAQLLYEVGFTIYPEPYAVRTADIEEERDCLEKLVPILQQSQIDYIDDPAETNELIVELVGEYNTGWEYTPGVAEFAVDAMLEHGIVANDPETGVLGAFDLERVQQIIDTFAPILDTADIKPDLVPEDLVTNEFLDESISLD
ncbi:hypothetical protein [Phytoactinopolyspora halotolerans]|uniref:ABC transporter substrate-binding protein n=1 Tax=Phytoactinopolyspora halotolerans TaxID=1981512 RepID=A0A6L9SGS6_9ACTN|nr:hypothetical protein [Phytoactinopolyspora halotolerans]NEE04456.1 hypothetical protein [Phytoactinopolyspora halotolerans]